MADGGLPGNIRIASVVGTRPEAIKMAPVAISAKNRNDINHLLIATGQQSSLFDDALSAFGITTDLHLGSHPGGGSIAEQVAAIAASVELALRERQPDIVLVQGDTNTALAAAIAAHRSGIPVGHVEAGLRSFDLERPFPEERNRVEIALLASLHFAPSPQAAANLEREKVTGTIAITGNPGIDAMMQLAPSERSIARHGDETSILVTCHRRENFGEPLRRICDGIAQIAQIPGVQITLPVHSNPAVAVPICGALATLPNVALVDPLDYPAMLAAICSARLVISDSGGLQEECAALGVPLLLLREETERPEVVYSGNCRLVGSRTKMIVDEARRLINDPGHHAKMAQPAFPYGTGQAAEAILREVQAFFALSPR